MPRYDYECLICDKQFEADAKVDETVVYCPFCTGHGIRIITKMPLRTYTKRPQDRLWGTSHLSSSEKFKEKQKRKGEKR